jgi:hypothetical protein
VGNSVGRFRSLDRPSSLDLCQEKDSARAGHMSRRRSAKSAGVSGKGTGPVVMDKDSGYISKSDAVSRVKRHQTPMKRTYRARRECHIRFRNSRDGSFDVAPGGVPTETTACPEREHSTVTARRDVTIAIRGCHRPDACAPGVCGSHGECHSPTTSSSGDVLHRWCQGDLNEERDVAVPASRGRRGGAP